MFKEVSIPLHTLFTTQTSEPSHSLVVTELVNIFTKFAVKPERELNVTWEPRTTALSCQMLIRKTL